MYEINVAKLQTKADNIERYYHVFTAGNLNTHLQAIDAFEDLKDHYSYPEYELTLTETDMSRHDLESNKPA